MASPHSLTIRTKSSRMYSGDVRVGRNASRDLAMNWMLLVNCHCGQKGKSLTYRGALRIACG
jgi:hypothetical protein